MKMNKQEESLHSKKRHINLCQLALLNQFVVGQSVSAKCSMVKEVFFNKN